MHYANREFRLALAMKGRREERAILIRDPNKLISLAVLSSPKLTESEVEMFARMTSVSEEVPRTIASTPVARIAASSRRRKTHPHTPCSSAGRTGDSSTRKR